MGYKHAGPENALGLILFFLLSACGVNNSSLSESSLAESSVGTSSQPSSGDSSSESESIFSSSESSSLESSSSSESSASESSSSSSEEASSSVSSMETIQTISIDTNGGSLVNPIVGLPGTYISTPGNPYKAGYTFAGWYAEAGLSTPYVFSKIPNQSITVYADWETNYLVYSSINTNELMVSGYNLNDPVDIWVPKYHQGKLVTAIDVFGFYGLRTLTTLKLPDSINQIGAQAFSGALVLTAINVYGLNTNYQTIAGSLYSGDGKTLVCYPNGKTATAFSIPEGVETIGVEAFVNELDLLEVTFPSTLKTVSEKAFMWCRYLSSVIMNEGLETIGENAFYATALVEVNLPSTLMNLATNAFDSTLTITSFSVASGSLYFSAYGDHLYNAAQTTFLHYAAGKSDTSFSIPSGVVIIGPSAFREANHLTEIILPEGLVNIEEAAFQSCSALTQITLPTSLYGIGDYAFRYCNVLTGIYIPESVQLMGHWVFDGCTAIHIYVQADQPGSGWDLDWNASKPVTWSYGG